MCVKPSFFWLQVGDGWSKIPKGCNDCWRCKQNKVNDWTGRGLCEADTSDWSLTLTLTYAPRWDGAEKHLDKSHFPDFIRSLRKRGHSIRYMVVAEKSEKNTQRVHFHCILWGRGEYPCGFYKTAEAHRNSLLLANAANDPFISKDRWPADKRRTWLPSWPHGHVCIDEGASSKSIRYVVKYLQKDDEKQWFSMSKKPLIGAEWIIAKGNAYNDHGVEPSSFEYEPPNGKKGHRYLLTGAARRLLIKTIKSRSIGKWLDMFGPSSRNEFVHKAFWSTQKEIWRKKQPCSTAQWLWLKLEVDRKAPSAAMMRNVRMEQAGYARDSNGKWWTPDEQDEAHRERKRWINATYTILKIGRKTKLINRAHALDPSDHQHSPETRPISGDARFASEWKKDATTPSGCCCSCCVASRKTKEAGGCLPAG